MVGNRSRKPGWDVTASRFDSSAFREPRALVGGGVLSYPNLTDSQEEQ